MSKNDPAFPATKTELAYDNSAAEYFPSVTSEGGLTKREWFAGMAMQGILSNITGAGIKDTADFAVQCADALISELERTA